MIKIKISDTGQKEIAKLRIDIEGCLQKILEFIPKIDLIGLSCIHVTDEPGQWKVHLARARAAYFQTSGNESAYIEIYLSRLFSHIKSAESLQLMVPIQNIGLAQTVFHEIGHHVEKARSHGIKNKKCEPFAENYAQRLMAKYLSANVDSIDSCFQNLEKIADEKGLSPEILRSMKDGWKAEYKRLCGGSQKA